jgi:hypothetical protein
MSMRPPVNRVRVRAFSGWVVVGLCALAAGVLSWCPPTQAATGHGFASSFGSFTSAVGVAVDDSAGASQGDVYVVDQGGGQVDRFTAAEAANDEAGKQLTGVTLVAPRGVAVDDSGSASTGDVYVTEPAEGVVDKFNGVTGKYEAQIDGSEVPDAKSHGFEPAGVGVDPANGDVFVTDARNRMVDVFTAAGGYASQFGAGLPSSPIGVAVDQAGDAYLTTSGGEAFELLAAGGYASVLPVGFSVSAVSVDPVDGDIYLDRGSEIEALSPQGEALGRFGSGSLSGSSVGVGVDSVSGVVYASNGASVAAFSRGETPKEPVATTSPIAVTGTSAAFNGTLAGGETGYHFMYRAGGSCSGGTDSEPAEITGAVAVSSTVSGLSPATQYAVCLVATNQYGATTGPSVIFTTAMVAPSVEGESFANVGANHASVTGQVDPQGSLTSYYYEYGLTSAYGSKTPEVSLPATQGTFSAPAQLTGLRPGSEYHFRLVAKNTAGETGEGPDAAFDTLPAGVSTLPDGRVYEMVTPANNQNADVYYPQSAFTFASLSEGVFTQDPFQVAVNGRAVAYLADPTTGGYGVGGGGAGNQYLAERSSAGGWRQRVVQPTGITTGAVFGGFSSNLSFGMLNLGDAAYPDGATLSPQAPGDGYDVLYARSNSEEAYRPLFTVTPERSPGEFGTHEVNNIGRDEEIFPVFAGGSADFSDILFEANDALLEGAGSLESQLREDVRQEIAKHEDHNYLYDSVQGRLSLVDVLPDGEVAPNATFGALPLGEGGRNPADFNGAISADGRFVYWTDLVSGVVYVREGGTATVPVSVGAARYWATAADGNYAYYTENGALYRFDATTDARVQLTSAEAEVQGLLGVSEDGSYVYFVAAGALAPGATQQACEPNNEGTSCNLYVLHEGKTQFIATLSINDGKAAEPFRGLDISEAEFGDWQPGLGHRTAEVVAGGNVVFMSNQGLAVVGFPHGYPNSGLDEVYMFDPAAGQLFCVSCSSSGEAPPASENHAAAFLPISWDDAYLPQWISADGNEVFFNSAVPLVPQDTNGRQDVYEWEREGTGGCGSGAGADGGCVYLLSGGVSESASWLLGAGESGEDVFVVTRAQLVPQDRNEAFDLYDVRVGGGEPVGEPACTGTGCQGVPAPPPTFATPSSVTFEGVGNFPAPKAAAAVQVKAKKTTTARARKLARALRACRGRHPAKRRVACEGQARRRYGAKVKRSAKGRG